MVVIKYIEAEGSEPRTIDFFDQDDLDRWLLKQGIQSLRQGAADGTEVGSFRGLEHAAALSVETVNYYPGPPLKNQPQQQANGEKCFSLVRMFIIGYIQKGLSCLRS